MGQPLTPEDAANITAITQLVVRERESRDLCMWNRMESCFYEEAYVDISWFQGSGKAFVEASKDMFERGMCAKHRLGPILVSLNGDRAVASLSAIIDVPETIQGVELTLSAHCLMLYKVEKRNASWGLMSFGAIYRRDEFVPAIPGQTLEIPEDELKSYRPSYRHLCYSLSLAGYEPNNELPGEDRPETVAASLEAVYSWAGLPVPD